MSVSLVSSPMSMVFPVATSRSFRPTTGVSSKVPRFHDDGGGGLEGVRVAGSSDNDGEGRENRHPIGGALHSPDPVSHWKIPDSGIWNDASS